MARNTILCKIFTFLLLLSVSYTQKEKLFFRKDYTYIEATESFYKVHTVVKNWNEAFEVCESEGAPMFYPEDENEANIVVDFFKEKSTAPWSHIGVNSFIAEGVFQTIDGKSILDVYHKWGAGEPNNGLGGRPEHCAEIVRAGTINDIDCDWKRPFICRKKLNTLEWSYVCDMPYTDYEYENDIGKCYKLHKEPKSWHEAYYTCHAEESKLATITSLKEAKHLVKMLKDVFLPEGQIHSGFYKRAHIWKTTRGKPLKDSGYADWEDREPDHTTVSNKTCGSMLSNGKLSNIDCSDKTMFFCDHEVIACDICELKK